MKKDFILLIILLILILLILGYLLLFKNKEGYQSFEYTIPSIDRIGTISWLLMPLLYGALRYQITYPQGFEGSFNDSLAQMIEFGIEIPFNNFEGLMEYIRERLDRLGVTTFDSGKIKTDTPFHISQGNQELILYNDENVRIFFETLAPILSSELPFQKIIIGPKT